MNSRLCGSFVPKLIAKEQRRFPGFNEKLISIYARGVRHAASACNAKPGLASPCGAPGGVVMHT